MSLDSTITKPLWIKFYYSLVIVDNKCSFLIKSAEKVGIEKFYIPKDISFIELSKIISSHLKSKHNYSFLVRRLLLSKGKLFDSNKHNVDILVHRCHHEPACVIDLKRTKEEGKLCYFQIS